MPKRKSDINQVWEEFETWSDQYLDKCDVAIDKIEKEKWKGDTLFLTQRPGDEAYDGFHYVYGPDFDAPRHKQFVRDKLDFLAVYYQDLSFDGTDSFRRHMRVLPLQLPRKRSGQICVWLERDGERKKAEPYASTRFLGDYVSLFCKSVREIDFSSANSALPFDYIYLENLGGTWTKEDAQEIALTIKHDLEFDAYEFVMKAKLHSPTYIYIRLIWDPKDLPSTEAEDPMPKSTIVKSPRASAVAGTKVSAKKGPASKAAAKKATAKKAARTNSARDDASLRSIVKHIQETYDLPKGSVKLVLPNGNTAHSDGKVKNLRKQWDQQ